VRPSRLAALPKIETPEVRNTFDRVWTIHRSGPNCSDPSLTFKITIEKGSVRGHAGGGSIRGSASQSGALSFSHPTRREPSKIARYWGRLQGRSGGGSFRGAGVCSGTFTVTHPSRPAHLRPSRPKLCPLILSGHALGLWQRTVKGYVEA
jgi:hypothetical protein